MTQTEEEIQRTKELKELIESMRKNQRSGELAIRVPWKDRVLAEVAKILGMSKNEMS